MNYSIGYYASIGGKSQQEDRLVCIEDMAMIPGLLEFSSAPTVRISYFAVFDGHGGKRCSDFLGAEFHKELARHPKLVSSPVTALRETWRTMDDLFYRWALQKARGDVSQICCDGSTATVALVVGNELYMLNCGDSSGGIIRKNGTIEILTEDHGAENATEAARIISNGGILRKQKARQARSFPLCCMNAEIVVKSRVYPGGLLVTRAFGDFNAKLPALGGISGVLIPDHSEIKHKTLDSNTKYIILASDGLWDGLQMKTIEAMLSGKRTQSSPALVNRVDIDRELDLSVFTGFNTLLDDEVVTQAYGIGKSAVASTAWSDFGFTPDNTSVLLIRLNFENQDLKEDSVIDPTPGVSENL